MTPKNIHIIFMPPKIFIFLKAPQKMETPKNDPERMYENIRVPPWGLTLPLAIVAICY